MKKLRDVRWDERSGAPQNAHRHLPALVSEYFAYGRKLLARRTEAGELHPLRLATKRLRYTLELFRPCYGPGLATRIGALQRLQKLLGEVNDTLAAERALTSSWRSHSRQRARVEKFLRDRGAVKVRDFRKQWTEVFDAPGRERWWTAYLARSSRGPARKA
jgi:CHAD domain-containing protein